ncbi:S8 family serine peptidase [Marinimicrobium agarilyticum]|uniref:S8 family serine peptidase n=1 Tax=Marinimicrobium agarilyticum TaxID=306546 RepID=UPI000428FEAF|nr:S8 family serine peptidase [Marinimicrobium agarilyticum]
MRLNHKNAPFMPLWLVAALWLNACGGGGSAGLPPSYTVSTNAGAGGSLSPSSQRVPEGGTAGANLSVEPGYALDTISGCGGDLSGARYTTAAVNADCTITARFVLEEYDIDTDVANFGNVSPRFATVTIEDTQTFNLQPDAGYRVASVSGCNGTLENRTYTVTGVQNDCTIDIAFEPDVYAVSGTLNATALNDFDTTLNDASTELLSNSDFNNAQPINNRATVAGFATAVAANIAPDFPAHFADATDPDDYYRVSLQAGQVVQLQVVDHDNFDSEAERYTGDLDLFLYAPDQSGLASSDGTGEYEEVPIAETGDYIIQVHAHSGTSKYILRILPDGAPTQTDLSQAQTGDFIPGEMVVIPKAANQATPQRRSATPVPSVQLQTTAPLQATRSQAYSSLQQARPRAYQKWMTLKALKAKRRDPAVAKASPNYLRYAQRIPNDRRYALQWHYEAINLPRAWDLTTGTPASGSVPIVAVIDTGVVLSHPDLTDKLEPGYDFIRDDERSQDGEPGIDNNPDDPGDGDEINPPSWHGTHVAGTVAASSDNGIGGAGVSWGARIMPMRALGTGGGNSYDIIQSVLYAAGLPNDSQTLPATRADIINLSLGGNGSSEAEAAVYADVRELGIIVVASSGNENTATPLYPASYPSVLSVGATDALGRRAPYSNYGETLDLVAPGGYLGQDANGDGLPDGILSTSAVLEGGTITPGYSLGYQGTSMAAPHVAGVLALMKAVYPDLSPMEVSNLLINGALTGTADRNNQLGYGQIDAERAVAAAFERANGNGFEWPARVTATPSTLNLGTTSEALVSLDPEGEVTPETIDVTTTETWLTVAPETVEENGLGDYRIAIDREGLSDGFYQGQVVFTIDTTDELLVDVYMSVGEPSSAGIIRRTYVLLVGEDSDNSYQAVAQVETGGERASFVFPEVAPGRYSLIAGTDIDADGFICQPGEQCGAYPSLEREQVIEVLATDRDGLDFVTGIRGGVLGNSAQSDTSPPPSGIPLKSGASGKALIQRQVQPQELR